MKLKSILSGEEIDCLADKYLDTNECTSEKQVGINGIHSFAHAVIEAYKEKLAEQTPVIYLYDGDLYSADDMGINGHIREHGTPLYAHPTPSRQAAPKCTEGK